MVALVWAQGLKYTSDIQAAFKEAKKSKKPVWVMVSATWCGPCKWVEGNLFPQKWFDSLISQHFVALKVYAASEEGNTPGGEAFANQYRVRAYPTFLYLTPEGEVLYRAEGAPMGESDEESQALWRKQVQEALSYYKDLPTLKQRFQRGDRSPDLVRRYFLWALVAGDSATFAGAWEGYLKTYPSIRLAWLYEPRAYVRILKAAEKLPAARAHAFTISDSLKSLLPHSEWKEVYEPLVEQELFTKIRQYSRSFKERGLIQPLIHVAETTLAYAKSLKARFPFAETMALAQVAEMLFRTKEAEYHKAAFRYYLQYFALTKSMEPPEAEERMELSDQLNGAAWATYERLDDPTYLWMAVAWTKEALSYQPDDWHIWDTLGALYYKLKRKEEAVEALSKALSLAKSKGVSEGAYDETQELLQKAQALE
jgi:thiol-disulfide isomerase/thioredoxin